MGKEINGFGDVSGGRDNLTGFQSGVFREVDERTRSAMNELGRSEESFGLLHADLHLGNVLYSGDDIRPIDFDDCGYGFYPYEFAVLLHEYIGDNNWKKYRDLMLEGYNEFRVLPGKQIDYLPIFMAARLAGLVLWCHVKAETYPNFRSWLPGYTKRSTQKLKTFLAKEVKT